MKMITIYLCILGLFISCKGKITNIKITPAENNKNYKCYMQKFGERPDIDFLQRDCPWIKDPANTVFVYMPISLELENSTGHRVRIATIKDNLNVDFYHPVIIGDTHYNYSGGEINISSGDKVKITMFVHLPVSISVLDKVYYDRLFPVFENHQRDSIVINEINPNLQKAIDASLKKKDITIHYHESEDVKKKAFAIYCVNRQKSATFRMDSIANLKDGFKYNCE